MSYTYTSFQQALALEMIIPNALSTAPGAGINDPNFQGILPTIVDYAENRCYRELDLLNAETQQWFQMVPYQRGQSYAFANAIFSNPNPTQQILIVNRVTIQPPNAPVPPLTPGAQPTTGGQPALPTTVDYMDAVYNGVFPEPGPFGVPERFALRDDQTIIFGPAPDDAYYFDIHGSCRPVPLYSAINPDTGLSDGGQMTFLTAWLPDLFLAAAMVSAAGYRHNFGAQSDDPRMAVSWEAQFQTLLPSAKNEEMQKKFLGWGMMSSRNAPSAPPAPPG